MDVVGLDYYKREYSIRFLSLSPHCSPSAAVHTPANSRTCTSVQLQQRPNFLVAVWLGNKWTKGIITKQSIKKSSALFLSLFTGHIAVTTTRHIGTQSNNNNKGEKKETGARYWTVMRTDGAGMAPTNYDHIVIFEITNVPVFINIPANKLCRRRRRLCCCPFSSSIDNGLIVFWQQQQQRTSTPSNRNAAARRRWRHEAPFFSVWGE